ncbi:MAG: metallophosphoesterase [Clostridia bacterium]|nr:metallophosphoesterase [Clostridia bacterium]
MSLYVCGDVHQDIDLGKLTSARFAAKGLSKNDYVLICGDCGAVWDGRGTDRYLQKWYEKKPWTTLFIDGNHENFDLLESYPVSEWNGGNVHRITPSLLHLMRGQVYTLDGRRLFTMGGASSHDKRYRKEGISWWERELPCAEEYAEARRNLAAAGNRTDYIFPHCAGSRLQDIISPEKEKNHLTDFLDTLESISFGAWYFGHYHKDLTADEKHTALFENVICLW